MTDFQIEAEHLQKGFHSICGVDEVGRGALFGPVVAAAVVLNPVWLHPDINDSKLLSPKKRRVLAEYIYKHARAYSIGWCWNDEIDSVNILNATRQAMSMAVSRLQISPDFILMDGMDSDFLRIPGRKIVGGDKKSISIAAASIIAKVFRDELIASFSRFFPEYGLHKNKGYPTKMHKNMLLLNGMTIYHRGTFRIRWPEKTG